MASGRSITRRAEERTSRRAALFSLAGLAAAVALPARAASSPACGKPLYLTLDTGHMGVAQLIADTLKRHDVRVTFFAAHERTQTGDGSLGNDWAPWWKARAAEGHEFAPHTFDHASWRADLPDGRFKLRPSAGPDAGKDLAWSGEQYRAELAKAARRLQEVTGKKPLPLFRAPGGKTSPRLLAAAEEGGWKHVAWAPAGFLGDELPSELVGNDALLRNALRDVRAGDILVAHLGIWSRKEPWAPAVLEPLLGGLRQRGFCFASLRDHPAYREWIAAHP
ncbi:polysaccharide deacetylase family protein [Ramlibacter sp.]|uniref:polysaccharide deacetylase family protein n=1 Tax=Ramlibacter sp. TaxID=1917967 RepID=UPI0017D6B788|nr:polysaccharide deacetylase family protein [Ramlibacter sp.]MBA2674139.1 polysaccharide deacetylase family protein [Ramlibacter sp.]